MLKAALIELRRSKLSEADWRINAIAHLGGVVHVLNHRRGVIVESFRVMDGEDCTQSVTRLERCHLVDPQQFTREITTSLRQEIAAAQLHRIPIRRMKGTKP